MLSSLGIDIESDLTHDKRVVGQMNDEIWRAALRETKEESIGIKFVDHFQLGSLSGLGFSWMASDTLLDGFLRLSRFFSVISNAGKIDVTEETDSIKVAFILPVPYGIAEDTGIDAGLALFVQLCRIVRGDKFSPSLLYMQRPQPSSTGPFDDFFGCPIHYNTHQNALMFAKTEVQKKLPIANPDLARANDQVVIDYLRKHAVENTSSKVSSLIVEALPLGTPSIKSIAEKLFMSTKTLQRRLTSEATTFSSLMNDVRQTLANNYLQQPWRSIGEVSYLLGFTEPSNFTRWYKTAVGISPHEYRETHQR
jgi:AraC-like DNA-binding protein